MTKQWLLIAVTCLAISLALAVLLAAALGTGLLQPPPGASNVVNIVSVALLALVTWKVAVGRRWARWLFVIVYALGALGRRREVIWTQKGNH
jgi:hypothetical protein